MGVKIRGDTAAESIRHGIEFAARVTRIQRPGERYVPEIPASGTPM